MPDPKIQTLGSADQRFTFWPLVECRQVVKGSLSSPLTEDVRATVNAKLPQGKITNSFGLCDSLYSVDD